MRLAPNDCDFSVAALLLDLLYELRENIASSERFVQQGAMLTSTIRFSVTVGRTE